MANTELTQDELRRLVTSAAHKERRILSFSIVVSVIAVVIGGLWLWYASARVKSLDQEYAGLIEAKDKELKSKIIELDKKKTEISEKQTELKQLESQKEALKNDIQEMRQFCAQTQGELSKGNEERAVEVVANSLRANPKIANLLPRVYIHIENQAQRTRAQNVETELQKQGFLVPGIQNVPGPRRRTELRYFRKAEENEAKQISAALERVRVNASVIYISGNEDSTKMRARHYELWFGSDW